MSGWIPCITGISIGLAGVGAKVAIARLRGRSVHLRRLR